MSKTLDDYDKMPFGKYKGVEMINVPASYLLWLYNNEKCSGAVLNYIVDNMDVLEKEVEASKN